MNKKVKKYFYKFVFVLMGLISHPLEGAAQEAQKQLPPQNLQEVAVQQLDTAKNLVNMIIEFFVNYSFQVMGGVIVLFFGWLIGGYLANLLGKFLQKKSIDITVSKFAVGSVKTLVIAFAAIVALGKFGIEIAPLIAGLSVAGVGIGFALQGPLSNYIAGAVLIFTKPFKVGDIIEVAGVNGEVMDMILPRTELKTVDGHKIIVPNKHIIGEIIHNFSEARRLDINIGISYSSDITKAIEIISEVIKSNEDTIKTKAPKIGIVEFADSSINIQARLWCPQAKYWDVMYDVNKRVFDEFGKNKIDIPFPQRDIHVFENK